MPYKQTSDMASIFFGMGFYGIRKRKLLVNCFPFFDAIHRYVENVSSSPDVFVHGIGGK